LACRVIALRFLALFVMETLAGKLLVASPHQLLDVMDEAGGGDRLPV